MYNLFETQGFIIAGNLIFYVEHQLNCFNKIII